MKSLHSTEGSVFFYKTFHLRKGEFITMGKRIFASIIIMFFCASLAIAAGPNRNGTRDQKKAQDQDCKIIQLDKMQNQITAKVHKREQTKDPDRIRDCTVEIIGAGSASYPMTAKQNMHRNGNQNQKGDTNRTQNRSCQG